MEKMGEKLKRSGIRNVNLYTFAEGLFIFAFSLYLIFLIHNTTTYRISLPLWTEEALFKALAASALIKSCIILWKKPEKKKYFIMLIMAFALAVLYYMVYKNTNYIFLKFLAVITVGMVGTDYEKIIKLYVVVAALMVGTAVLAALSGVINDLVYVRAGTLRSSLGIIYPTDFAAVLFYITVFGWIGFKRIPDWIFTVLGFFLAALSYFLIYGKNGTICSVFFILVVTGRMIYQFVAENHNEKDTPSNGRLRKISIYIGRLGISAVFLFIASVSFILTYAYHKGFSFAEKINEKLNSRLLFNERGVLSHSVGLFGNHFDQRGAGASLLENPNYNFIDNSYILILLRYGLLIFICIAFLWTLMSYLAFKMGDIRLALGMALFAAHSFMEHHFIEMNYNILIVLPFSVIGAALINNKRSEEIICQEGRKQRIISGLVTAAIMGSISFIIFPRLFPWLRTLWEVAELTNMPVRRKLSFMGFLSLLSLLGLLAAFIYRFCLSILNKERLSKVWYIIPAALCIFMVLSIAVSRNIILKNEGLYSDMLAADEKAVNLIKSVEKENGGSFSCCVVPEYYRRRYGISSNSFFSGDELARYDNMTVLMPSGYNSRTFLKMDYKYSEISLDHAVYSNDPKVISVLEQNGYVFTDYFSKKMDVDLNRVASYNNLGLSGENKLELNGNESQIAHGPYIDLFEGTYQISFDLTFYESEEKQNKNQDQDKDQKKDIEEDKDEKICTLYVRSDYGQTDIAEIPVFRSDYDVSENHIICFETYIKDSRGTEFLLFPEADYEVEVRGISYQEIEK